MCDDSMKTWGLHKTSTTLLIAEQTNDNVWIAYKCEESQYICIRVPNDFGFDIVRKCLNGCSENIS